MIDYSGTFVMNDQPATCPLCGARTEFTSDLFLIPAIIEYHKCLAPYCQFEFIMENDSEIYERWSKTLDER